MTKTTAFKNQYADSRDFMTSLLFRKWMIAIILSLGVETKRYSTLHRSLPGVSVALSSALLSLIRLSKSNPGVMYRKL